jgi:hypothetical protein
MEGHTEEVQVSTTFVRQNHVTEIWTWDQFRDELRRSVHQFGSAITGAWMDWTLEEATFFEWGIMSHNVNS